MPRPAPQPVPRPAAAPAPRPTSSPQAPRRSEPAPPALAQQRTEPQRQYQITKVGERTWDLELTYAKVLVSTGEIVTWPLGLLHGQSVREAKRKIYSGQVTARFRVGANERVTVKLHDVTFNGFRKLISGHAWGEVAWIDGDGQPHFEALDQHLQPFR